MRRIGVDPLDRLLGSSAGLIADVSKSAGAPIIAATGEAITDSQAKAAKHTMPFQSYIGMRQALDLLRRLRGTGKCRNIRTYTGHAGILP